MVFSSPVCFPRFCPRFWPLNCKERRYLAGFGWRYLAVSLSNVAND
jgi:hypothetical protein